MKESMRIFLIFIIFLSGCGGGRVEFIIYRDVPTDPSITVLPEDPWSDRGYARDIEKSLIKLGQTVINPPPPRRLEKVESEAGSNSGAKAKSENDEAQVSANGKRKSATITETFWNVVDVQSTHMAFVSSNSSSFRLVEKSSGHVLAVAEIRPRIGFSGSTQTDASILSDLLKSIGFKVRELKSP